MIKALKNTSQPKSRKSLGLLTAEGAGGGAVSAAKCPAAILDTSPDGSGLGVWVLVESDAKTCTYEYGGGIV